MMRRFLVWSAVCLAVLVVGGAAFLYMWPSADATRRSGSAATARHTGAAATTTTATTTTVPPTTNTTRPPVPAAAPVVYRVATNDPVAFITIDDGWTADPRVLDLIKQRNLPVTTFLMGQTLDMHLDFWKQLPALGVPIEDHTISHPNLRKLSQDAQHAEICGDADAIEQRFGTRPVLFCPPFGNQTPLTATIVPQCGMYVTVEWTASIAKGAWGWYDVQRLVPGDIILMHWQPYLYDDLVKTLDAVQAAGLHPAPLLDYVGPFATHAPVSPPPKYR